MIFAGLAKNVAQTFQDTWNYETKRFNDLKEEARLAKKLGIRETIPEAICSMCREVAEKPVLLRLSGEDVGNRCDRYQTLICRRCSQSVCESTISKMREE